MTTQTYIPVCHHGVPLISNCPTCALEQRLKAPSPPDARDAEIASLRAALTAAESRARRAEENEQRYLWLRNRAKRTQFGNKHHAGEIQVFKWEDRTTANIMSGDALDAAIDAARGKER